ncbi:ImmA/IrrE family metallo-endopeptidase [Cellulosimicrobium funkei]
MNIDAVVARAVATLPSAAADRFAYEPLEVMRADLSLTVTAVERLAGSRDDGGACDGVSFLEDGVVLYAPTESSRRENFTLAHELGHWLVEHTPGLYDWIIDQPDPGPLLETVCDRIAQRLLLPSSLLDSTLPPRTTLRAHHLVDLYNATQASRPVCAIALAQKLPNLGAVVLINRYTRSVSHSSIRPDPDEGWPRVYPWRGQTLSPTHPMLTPAAGATTSKRVRWTTPWGTYADFYADLFGETNRVIAILSAIDLWGVDAFHAQQPREFDTRPLLTGYCCDADFEIRQYPCSGCQGPTCPRCGRCRCDRQAEREARCAGCFMMFASHLLEDGRCEDCR